MKKKVSILGSTGSIGTQAIDVCEKADFQIVTLTAHKNGTLLAQQGRQLGVKEVIIGDESQYTMVKDALKDTNIVVSAGREEICRAAKEDESDIVLNAIVGIAGLGSTIATIEGGKTLALANKESLVAGGELVMGLAQERNTHILPVDSEHSAIFQCLNGENWDRIERVLLTASGGPFFGYTTEQLKQVTKAQALKHPNWEMGAKITIDSSTLMNKGLEFIEAMYLFNVSPEQIQVVVHPQSILHSGVEFEDGSVIAQLGASDMRVPIQYALTYPDRIPGPAKKLSLFDVARMDFLPPDIETFCCLDVAIQAAKRGGLYGAAVNGANEEIVGLFLQDKCSYYDIFTVAKAVLNRVVLPKEMTLENVYEADRLGRAFVRESFGY